ncbi:MAG: hypothetical protein IKT40_06160 [Bacilli bacterium]|nr:hypothetical protein [Bacilli bacterium]
MLTLYYNKNGLNIIKDNHIYNFSSFDSNYINLYNNDLLFDKLIISEGREEHNYNEFFKFNKKYNILKINLDFPYIKSSIFKSLNYYEFPKYYSPTFNYELKEQENKYYLGVYQTLKHIATGEDAPIVNFVVFLSDKNTGEIVWYWEMFQYFIDNDLSLDWTKNVDTPIIYALSRIGKNNFGLDENDIMFTISKINQILFVKPFENTIDKIINITDIVGKNPSNFIDAHIIPKGLAGEGNLLFFNNNINSLSPSEIIEYDLANDKIIFEWSDEKINNKGLGSSVQKLPNGNYFIYSYTQNRLLELSPSKEIVNEFIISDETKEEKESNIYQMKNCYTAVQIPDEWASNFINNYKLIESVIKNYE